MEEGTIVTGEDDVLPVGATIARVAPPPKVWAACGRYEYLPFEAGSNLPRLSLLCSGTWRPGTLHGVRDSS
jgi:hypothetical protein